MQKKFRTFIKINITVFRGYEWILYWLVKLISEFLTFKNAIKAILTGFVNSTLDFDIFFLTKLMILKKIILHWNWCKSGHRSHTEVYKSSSGSLKCLSFGNLNRNLRIWLEKSLWLKVVVTFFLTELRILQKIILH